MNLNTTFRCKENDHEANPCIVEKIVELSAAQFASYTKNLMKRQPFLAEYADHMGVDRDGLHHCVLVLGEDHDDGILIRSEGAEYARYSSYIANARQIVAMQAQSETLSARSPLPFSPERMERLLDRALDWIGEHEAGDELYDTLKNTIGMTDEEIKAAGFELSELDDGEDEEPGMTME